MATYTDNYQLTKPTYAEQADIRVINSNMNIIDEVMHSSQISLADAYDSTKSYAEGDRVMYELLMYKCISPTTGVWDGSKWERTTASESGGGGSAELDILGEGNGAVVSFADGASAGLAKCIAEIVPKQAGTGTPSPSNIRPISGSTFVTITVSDGTNDTAYTTALGQTVYGGQLNVLTGELTVEHVQYVFDGNERLVAQNAGWGTNVLDNIIKSNINNNTMSDILCDIFSPETPSHVWNNTSDNIIGIAIASDNYKIRFYSSAFVGKTSSEVATEMSGHMLIFPLATPQTVQLTPQEVNSLLGQNNISADTGDVDIVYVKASAPIQPNPTGTPTATLKKLGIEGTVFEVPSGGGGSSSGINYSTTEQVVGTWIDGKPLYMRTFDLGSDIQVPYNTFINTTIDAVDKKAIIGAFGVYSTGETFYPLVANINNGIIRLQACRDNQVALVQYVTIKYTKITD